VSDHALMPKHGEEVVVDKAKVSDIIKAYNNATMDLAAILTVILVNNRDSKIKFHCKQCLRDLALQYHDLANMISELVNDPRSKG